MKTVILFTSAALACGLLLVNIYTSLVDARSWGSDLPNSIGVAREFYKSVNPGDFFRIFSPANQLFGLLALILCWKTSGQVRIWLGAAFICYIAADAFTFAYFYPRNDILFKTAQLSDVALLKKTWSEWSSMNWLRSAILLVGVVFSFLSVTKILGMRTKTMLVQTSGEMQLEKK